MTSWQDEYLSALQVRDRKEKVNKAIYDAYTKLADRAATLDAYAAEKPVAKEPSLIPTQTRKTSGSNVASESPTGGDTLARARQDLSEAQRGKGVMQSRLDTLSEELQKLKLRSQLESKRIRELTTEKTSLSTRMRDQDEELKGKAKLLEDVHDENLSLTLQLNMAEEQRRTLKGENKDLVDRWMARMGEEAEAMNKASKFS